MKIYRKKQIAFVVVLLNLLLTAANVAAQTEKQIAAIRAEVNSINQNSKNYTRKTKSVEGISLEGAEAVYFVADRRIKKIAAKLYGETYRSTAEIYYVDDQPIFIYTKTDRYEMPIGTTKRPKIISTEEQRIYLDGGKTVKVSVGKTILKSSDARYGEIEKSLVELSETLTAAYPK